MNAPASTGYPLTVSRILIIAAALCFGVAILIALGAFHTNYDAWLAGGLLSYMLSYLIP